MSEKNQQIELPYYEALNFDGLERKGNYRIVAYREDMLHAFEKKDAAATLFHIIYRWQTEVRKPELLKEIERRKKKNEKPLTPEEAEDRMFVYMSYNSFVRECGGAIGYNTVVRTLDYLVNTVKAFERRENHDPNFADYEYSVNKECVRALLQELPVFPPFAAKLGKHRSKGKSDIEGSTQMGTADFSDDCSTQNEFCDTQMGTATTQMGTATTQMGTYHRLHTDYTQITPQKEEFVVTAHADDNTPSFATDLSMLSDEDILKELSRRQLLTQEMHPTRVVGNAPSLEETFETFAPPVEETAQPALFEVPAAEQASIVQITNTDLIARWTGKIDKVTKLTDGGTYMKALWTGQTKRPLLDTKDNVSAFNGLARVVDSDQDFNDVYTHAKISFSPKSMSRNYDTLIGDVCKQRNNAPVADEHGDATQSDKRIDAVYATLDMLTQETTGDKTFTWTRSSANTEAIATLLKDRIVSPERLRLVYMTMYKMAPDKNGFCWKDKMSIQVVCRNYDTQLAAVLTAQKNERRTNNITLNPPVEPVIQPTTRTFQLRRVSREAVAAN